MPSAPVTSGHDCFAKEDHSQDGCATKKLRGRDEIAVHLTINNQQPNLQRGVIRSILFLTSSQNRPA
jgi:hypothetical protein